METPPPQKHLPDDVLVELTLRSVRSGPDARDNGTANVWAQYSLLLLLATSILNQAPQSREACEELDALDQVGKTFAQIIEVLHALMPDGIMEIISYLPPEKRKKGWGRGIDW